MPSDLFVVIQPEIERGFGNAHDSAYTNNLKTIRVAQLISLSSADSKDLSDFRDGIRPLSCVSGHTRLSDYQNLLSPHSGDRTAQRHTMHLHYTEDSAAHQSCGCCLLFREGKMMYDSRVDRDVIVRTKQHESARLFCFSGTRMALACPIGIAPLPMLARRSHCLRRLTASRRFTLGL